MHKEISDLEFAFNLAVLADTATLNSGGIPVTAADGDAEDAILKALTATQPDDGFLGEETSSRPSRNGRRWIVDGIDGTGGFVAGLPTWGTLIALEQEGEITLGMISSPAQDKRWWAQKGCGAFTGTCHSNRNGRQIRVSTNTHDCKSRCYFAPVQRPSRTSPTVY